MLKSPFTSATPVFLSPSSASYFGFGKISIGKTLLCDIGLLSFLVWRDAQMSYQICIIQVVCSLLIPQELTSQKWPEQWIELEVFDLWHGLPK